MDPRSLAAIDRLLDERGPTTRRGEKPPPPCMFERVVSALLLYEAEEYPGDLASLRADAIALLARVGQDPRERRVADAMVDAVDAIALEDPGKAREILESGLAAFTTDQRILLRADSLA